MYMNIKKSNGSKKHIHYRFTSNTSDCKKITLFFIRHPDKYPIYQGIIISLVCHRKNVY